MLTGLEPVEAFETSPCCLRNSRYRHLSYTGKTELIPLVGAPSVASLTR